MKNNRRILSWRGLLREVAGVALPGLLAAGLFAVLPGKSHSQGEGRNAGQKTEDPKLCGEWHRGAGDTSPLDLIAVRRAYEALRDRVAKAVDRSKVEMAGELDRPFDAGLPACHGAATRSERLPRAEAGRIAGRVFYFVSVSDPARLAIPREVAEDPAAQIVVLRVGALRDLPAVARMAGRGVSLGGADLAKALGVRCANTWLKVSEKGDAVELHESR